MITGFLVGIAISLFVVLLGFFIIDIMVRNKVIAWTILWVLVFSIIAGTTFLGRQEHNIELQADIDGFIAIKNTYESLIDDPNLTPLERLQISDHAIEQNMLLARRKAEINAWYNFDIKQSLKDELAALTPIGLEETA